MTENDDDTVAPPSTNLKPAPNQLRADTPILLLGPYRHRCERQGGHGAERAENRKLAEEDVADQLSIDLGNQ